MQNYAVLFPIEEASKYARKNTPYKYKYDSEDNFFIWSEGEWREETSTAFDFVNLHIEKAESLTRANMKSQNAVIIEKVIDNIQAGNIVLPNVSIVKTWYSFNFDIKILNWDINQKQGFEITIRKGGDFVGTLTIDYTSEELYKYSARLNRKEVSKRLENIKNKLDFSL